MTVNKERVELWAQALESEKYVQCAGILRGREGPGRPLEHCALGVGIAVAQANGLKLPSGAWESLGLPLMVMVWYGLDSPNPNLNLDPLTTVTVVNANDHRQLPFWDIAQALRATYLKDEG